VTLIGGQLSAIFVLLLLQQVLVTLWLELLPLQTVLQPVRTWWLTMALLASKPLAT
jgi:hypothetical protein